MSFPSGWTHTFTVTIDRTKVTGTPTNFILLVTPAMLPASVIDGGATSAQDGGGDLRFTADAAGTQRLPIEVVDFHPDPVSGNRRCEIWVNMAGVEPGTGTDKVVYGWCRGPTTMLQPAPSQPYGAEAVWATRDFKAVHHMNAAAAPEQYGLWLVRPRAVAFGGATYMTWLDAAHGGTGNIRVAKFDHATGRCVAAVTVAAAEMIDAHAAPSICVSNGGFVHVVWGGFSAASAVLKTARSSSAGDITAWGGVVTVATGGGATDRTYPTLLCLSSGTLVLFSRETDAWHRRTSTDNGATWGNDQVVLSSSQRSYTEWVLGGGDRVHVAWHTTASSGATNGLNGYYLYSDNADAATSIWKAVDGTAVGTPLASDAPGSVSGGRVFSTSGLGFNTSYLRGLAVNGGNAPMLSFDSFVTGAPAGSAAMSFTYGGGSWNRVDVATGAAVGLASSGSFPRAEGGVRFIAGSTWRVLMGVTVSGVAEVQEWESTNDGASWAKVADVTAGSSRGNWQAQYIRGAVGPIVATHLVTSAGNKDGSVFNNVSDSVWAYGPGTDGVAGWLKDAVAPTAYLRDSTKFHNDATAVGAPTEVAGAKFGMGQSVTGTAGYVMASNATLAADVAGNMHFEAWVRHTGAGSAEKTVTKNSSAGNGSPYVFYRNGSNDVVGFYGNGSTFVSPTVAGVGASGYRLAGQFFGNSASLRVNKTGSGASALAGPLVAVSDAVALGSTLVGSIDELRIGATQVGTNALDTEYDNQNAPGTFAAGADLGFSVQAAGLGSAAAFGTAAIGLTFSLQGVGLAGTAALGAATANFAALFAVAPVGLPSTFAAGGAVLGGGFMPAVPALYSFTVGAAFSRSWRRRAKAAALLPVPPTLSGSAVAGGTLTVNPGSLAGVSSAIKYQWFAGGEVIAEASGASLSVDSQMASRLIECCVVGIAPAGAAMPYFLQAPR